MKIPRSSDLRLSVLGMVFGTLMLAASIGGAAAQEKSQDKVQPVWPTREWQTSTPEDRRCLSQNELRFKPESLRSIRPRTTLCGQNWSNYFPAQKIE